MVDNKWVEYNSLAFALEEGARIFIGKILEGVIKTYVTGYVFARKLCIVF
jgi:hypothetical protein